jgi:glycosyltransferase involved in cell wall biosynthesis
MKPKILQVVLDMQFVGEKVVAALARAISDEFEVMFCCLDRIGLLGERLRKEGFFFTSLNRTSGFDYSLPLKIAGLTREKHIDIIHAHHYTPYFYSGLSRFFYHRPLLVFTEHGRDFPDIVSCRRKFSNLFLNLVTDKITSVCEFSKKGLIENEKLPKSKIEVIYNGIEPIDEKINLMDESNQKVLDWIGASDNVIGFLARLEWIKNPELLIDAFAIACKDVPEAKLVIMGKGEMMESLQNRCKEYNISNNVLFSGLIKNPMPIVSRLKALVVTSLCEAASLSILEAMMCGVPVLATNVGGNPELVTDGVTGYLIESGSAQGFAEAMVKVMSDKSMAKNLGKNAKADVMERFSFTTMAEKYKKIYNILAIL